MWLLFFPFLLILRSFYCVNYNQHPFYICEQFLFFLLLRGTEKAGFVFFLGRGDSEYALKYRLEQEGVCVCVCRGVSGGKLSLNGTATLYS